MLEWPIRPSVYVLDEQLRATGIPIIGVSGNNAPFIIVYAPEATAADKSKGDAIAAAFVDSNYQKRTLSAIRADVQALTTGQWNKVWTDLSAAITGPPAIPRKYLADPGLNAGSIFVFDWALYVTGPTAAQQLAGQKSLAAMYVQDNPFYLVNPSFDSTINITGYETV